MNLEKAKQEFIRYTEKYDLQNSHISGKQTHTLRVMEISKQIAEGLGLEKEEVELAALIGLLHDIARFEQYTQYKTFRDLKSIDHGDYGVEILEKDIRKYIETDRYDELIKTAVKNHNKYQIENGLTEKEELFSKIIRDADKIDILYESIEICNKGEENIVEESTITEEVFEQFKNKKLIKRNKKTNVESAINGVVSEIAFIFDINFKSSFEILKEEDYINKMVNRYNIKDEDTKQKMEEVRKIANEFIDGKI